MIFSLNLNGTFRWLPGDKEKENSLNFLNCHRSSLPKMMFLGSFMQINLHQHKKKTLLFFGAMNLLLTKYFMEVIS